MYIQAGFTPIIIEHRYQIILLLLCFYLCKHYHN